MKEEKVFNVTIKSNGHILYNCDLIAILGQWNNYWDLDPDTLINQIKGKK